MDGVTARIARLQEHKNMLHPIEQNIVEWLASRPVSTWCKSCMKLLEGLEAKINEVHD